MNIKTISVLAAFTVATALQAELFVETLAATDLTSDSALLNMSVWGDVPETVFTAQTFDFGISSGRLGQRVRGYDLGKFFVFDPIVGERVLIETYNVRNLDAYFTVDVPGEFGSLFNQQTMETISASTPLTLNLWNLQPETTYYVQASAMDVDSGVVYFGEEISFTTLSTALGGSGIQFGSAGTVPEPSSFGLWIGLGAIGMMARRRQRR